MKVENATQRHKGTKNEDEISHQIIGASMELP